MSIYERIKAVCDKKNLTISAVESTSNISNGSISKWKTQMPKADNLFSVASCLGHSVEYFLTGEEFLSANLTPSQQEWLSLLDKLDPIKQAEFKGELKGYIKAKEEK